MKNITLFLITFVVAMLLGCSAIKQRTIQDDLEEITENVAQAFFDPNNLVQVACENDELFALFELEAPGTVACKAAMLVPDDEERVVIYDAASCLKEHSIGDRRLVECLDEIDGLKEFAEKLSKTKIVD